MSSRHSTHWPRTQRMTQPPLPNPHRTRQSVANSTSHAPADLMTAPADLMTAAAGSKVPGPCSAHHAATRSLSAPHSTPPSAAPDTRIIQASIAETYHHQHSSQRCTYPGAPRHRLSVVGPHQVGQVTGHAIQSRDVGSTSIWHSSASQWSSHCCASCGAAHL
jgi:hypothetical protein